MAQRPDSQVTVDDMAQQANVSRRTPTRHFRAGTGMVPSSGSWRSASSRLGAGWRPHV
ncbi:hypothetical protein [Streptomyces radiopugnans]|uniref:hypothetical protein n=1 Tax=Streptomyces radiopugnans TaxID=403935 RepID=UPI003F1DB4EA